jgi:hypothetical protein
MPMENVSLEIPESAVSYSGIPNVFKQSPVLVRAHKARVALTRLREEITIFVYPYEMLCGSPEVPIWKAALAGSARPWNRYVAVFSPSAPIPPLGVP